MTPDPLIVRVDQTPHDYLSPNSDKHRRTRQPYADALKQAAACGAINALAGKPWRWDGPIRLRIEVYWGKRPSGQWHKTMDWDNLLASCKAAIDGIFVRISADDRQIAQFDTPQQFRDPAGKGYMVFVLEAIEVEGEEAA